MFSDAANDAANVSVLSATLQCPVAQINYRCSKEFRFPIPIHDTIAGYDWVQQNLLPKRSITRAGRSEHVGVIAVCGELIGGQLATALALTECRRGEPGVVAVAINNPIVDWVSLRQQSSVEATTTTLQSLSAEHYDALSLSMLVQLQNAIFAQPADCFDSFASPIHFFRTAGVAVPPRTPFAPVLDEMAQLAASEREQLYGEKATSRRAASSEPDVDHAEIAAAPTARKASLRFPSRAFGLQLPEFHIAAGKLSPIRAQAAELARQLQKSFAREYEAHSSGPVTGRAGSNTTVVTDAADHHDGAPEWPVVLHRSSGFGLWDDSPAGRERLQDAAGWMAARLQER